MAEANPKVMEMVQAELKKNPEISNEELREKAKSLDKGIDKLNARQFNATYPLQVKRSMKPTKRRGRKPGRPAKRTGGAGGKRRRAGGAGGGARRGRPAAGAAAGAGGGNREQVRRVLVDLAREVAEGDRGALVEVAAGIDRYVDRVLKAAG